MQNRKEFWICAVSTKDIFIVIYCLQIWEFLNIFDDFTFVRKVLTYMKISSNGRILKPICIFGTDEYT